ncbi:MAG: metal-dependent transcriptional regulator [Oscillospiraceae bacterium]|jgi:Mn-dependent DtxR family transcriptional regulator|nr:metal-dependent transcriptional regulator [Oscillospiraceae bacterium]
MKIQESAENYLETILVLGLTGDPVRSVDIANEMHFSKPSVSIAMKNLRMGGYVQFGPSMHVLLTPSGREIAERMYERHVFLTDWLTSLGVDEADAARDACKMEHVLSVESFDAIKSFAKKHPSH